MEEVFDDIEDCPSSENYNKTDKSRGNLASCAFYFTFIPTGGDPFESAQNQHEEKCKCGNYKKKRYGYCYQFAEINILKITKLRRRININNRIKR